MKRNEMYFWRKFILTKIAFIVGIAMFLPILLFVTIGAPMRSFISILHYSDIVYNYKMSIACVGGIPFLLCAIFMILRALFCMSIRPPEKNNPVERYLLPLSALIFTIFLIASWLVPFLLKLTDYQPCPGNLLQGYYVIDLKLCKTITPPAIFW